MLRTALIISATLVFSASVMGQVNTAAMQLNQQLEARRLQLLSLQGQELNNLLREQRLEQAERQREGLHGLTPKQRRLLRQYRKTHPR